jgi:hypothetical protein
MPSSELQLLKRSLFLCLALTGASCTSDACGSNDSCPAGQACVEVASEPICAVLCDAGCSSASYCTSAPGPCATGALGSVCEAPIFAVCSFPDGGGP